MLRPILVTSVIAGSLLLSGCEEVVTDADETATEATATSTPTPVIEPAPEAEVAPAPVETVPMPEAGAVVVTPQNLSPLMARYEVTASTLLAGKMPSYQLSYLPRQFAEGLSYADQTVTAAGSYTGWDVLFLPENPAIYGGVTEGADWLKMTLRRDTLLGVAWPADATKPAWLDDYATGGMVSLDETSYQIYRRALTAGEHVLPAPAGGTTPYFVLSVEADGQPTPAPVVPEGFVDVLPNKACPDWVHEQYVAEGPDGEMYRTWHPQVDPVYHCTFSHEHGSDPALMPGDHTVVYGYVSSKMQQNESHNGFKNYTLQAEDGNWWTITLHSHMTMQRRRCLQLHTLKYKVVSPEGELLADVHYKGDFGAANSNGDSTNDQPVLGCEIDQATVANQSPNGKRVFPVQGDNNLGLESWTVLTHNEFINGSTTGKALGIKAFSTVFYFLNPALVCGDAACESLLPTGQFGERRVLLQPTPTTLSRSADLPGEFYTDPYGNQPRVGTETDAVKQYIKPGVELKWATKGLTDACVTQDAQQMLYVCGNYSSLQMTEATPATLNLEGNLLLN